MNIFKKELVQFIDQVESWEKAIKLASNPLFANGYVSSHFAQNLINETKRLGPYYILSDNLALAHITPNASTIKTGISLLYLNTPVSFKHDGTKKVKFLFVLSTIDSDSHLELLKELSLMFGDKQFYKEFYKVTSYKDILNLAKKINPS